MNLKRHKKQCFRLVHGETSGEGTGNIQGTTIVFTKALHSQGGRVGNYMLDWSTVPEDCPRSTDRPSSTGPYLASGESPLDPWDMHDFKVIST